MAKSIFFVMPNLGGGGGERVISILINNLEREKYIPHLVLLKESENNSFLKDLSNDIIVHKLGVRGRIKYAFPIIILRLLELVKLHSPDVLFFGSGQINAMISPFLFLFPKEIKLVARESNLPSIFEKYRIIKFFYRHFYSNYDIIIVQSDDMLNDLSINFKIAKKKLYKINNPVDIKFINNKLMSSSIDFIDKDKINLLAVGRLTHQKGFDNLIKYFAEINDCSCHLYILGDGEDLKELTMLSKKLGVEDRIEFLGNVENPYEYMRAVDGLILSSRYEGFPNVILESLVCGTPVLANNCPGGINEIIKPGFNGQIFSFKEKSFKEKLIVFLKTKFDKENIKKDAQNRFSVEVKILEFQAIFNLL